MSFVPTSAALAFSLSFLAACAGSPPPAGTSPGSEAPTAPPAGAPASAEAPPPTTDAAPAAAATPADPSPAGAKSAPAPAAVEPFPRGAKVLVIGDSFAQSLGVGMKTFEADLGVKVVMKGEQATYIPEWAGTKRDVPGLLRHYKPDLVVISLGGNELAMIDPTVRGPRVKELVGHMGAIPCIWVAPALWGNKETGLLDVIRKNSSPCRHFDSNKLTPDLPRGGDKIHPTPEGQKKWAKALVDWIRVERDASKETFALRARPEGE